MPLWIALLAPFAPAIPWALNFAAPPRVPTAGDLNADGLADLIAIYPEGDGIVDVSLNVEGQKAGRPFQALSGWGKGAVAAICGDFHPSPGNELLAICPIDTKGLELRLAGALENGKLKPLGTLGKLGDVRKPEVRLSNGSIEVFDRASGKGVGFKIGEWRGSPVTVPKKELPTSTSHFAEGDADNDGDTDRFEFRYGREPHTAFQVLLHRALTGAEPDQDFDGLPNAAESASHTDPLNPDSDSDGLLDGWEVNGTRGLDLPGLGCDPTRTDIVCLISRFDDVPEARVKAELDRAVSTYRSLGWGLHLIYRPPITGEDKKRPWWQNRDRCLPPEWRGIAHWMQVTQGGGGQADQMGDGGSCGLNALWAVFLHEFGHQLGMDHNGFWGPGLCPIYRSLMNYAYSYSLEDDGNKIAYSTGEFKGYTLNETDLDETIPLPYEQVKFLEKGPYRFRLKPNGKTTQIDWNWNGVFGEKGIRADINYSYSTNAGTRDEVDRSMTAPWLFVHETNAYILYGQRPGKLEAGKDPDVSLTNKGNLLLRRLISPKKWEQSTMIDDQLVGDPVAISAGGKIVFVYARPEGIVFRRSLTDEASGIIRIGNDPKLVSTSKASKGEFEILDTDPTKVPSIGQIGDRTFVFLWDPRTHEVTYRSFVEHGKPGETRRLFARSTVPVGMAVDTVRKELILGMAQDQDDKKTSRWQVRRFRDHDGLLEELGMEWVDGESGNARISGRVRVLFRKNRDTGPSGRIYMYAKGFHGTQSPWACTYVAESIADKTVRGGWLVKRMYDEWTQSRSAPAATWYDGDVLWAYRWVDGGNPERDNLLHVGYRGLGIDPKPMGDHDDLGYLREFGIRHSLIYLSRP